jgi:predicted permease
LNERGPSSGRFQIEGKPPATPESWPRADFQRVSPDFFRTIGIPILQGRSLSEADREGAPYAAVVNAMMARRFFPGEDPIGKRIGVDGREPGEILWLTIAGVVGDVRQYGLANPPVEQVYVPLSQFPGLGTTCLVRTAAEPARMERLVRADVHAVGAEQPVDHFRTLEQVHASSLDSPRLTTLLLSLFALLALVITATGIAGVIAFSVGQRRQEFGIRMALGALPSSVRKMVLSQGMRPVAIGLLLGVGGAFALSRLWASLLFEVAPSDPPTYVAVALLLAGVAAAACFVPARRATAVDPMVALRG